MKIPMEKDSPTVQWTFPTNKKQKKVRMPKEQFSIKFAVTEEKEPSLVYKKGKKSLRFLIPEKLVTELGGKHLRATEVLTHLLNQFSNHPKKAVIGLSFPD